jgi:hypothetical protein
MQMNAESMRACAERCAEAAASTNDPIAKRRYARLSSGWSFAADNQDWLDGRKSTEHINGSLEEKSLDAVVRDCPL